jgi:hypothetical protein
VPALGGAAPASRTEGADRRAGAGDAERPALQPMLAPFDGFHESEHAVTGTCLISFDRNRYSVMAKAARRTVQVRAYADRIVVRCGDEVVAEHPRYFGRDRTIYDPWHYLPVLAKQARRAAERRTVPGLGSAAGACPAAAQARDWRRSRPPVRARVLSAVLTDGLEPVEAGAISRVM